MRGITPKFIVKHDGGHGAQADWIVQDGGDGSSVVAMYGVRTIGDREFYSLTQLRGPWSDLDKSDSDPRKWRIVDNPAYKDEQAYCSTQALRILEILNAGIDVKEALKESFGGPVLNFPEFVKEVRNG
jgi:hypothetical protein